MTIDHTRRFYGVPATRGGIIHIDGERATILSATHHLHVRFASGIKAWIHPTCDVTYQECHEEVIGRSGFSEPCDRPAVGYRIDPEYDEEDPYPVCRIHHRGPFTQDEALREVEATTAC